MGKDNEYMKQKSQLSSVYGMFATNIYTTQPQKGINNERRLLFIKKDSCVQR